MARIRPIKLEADSPYMAEPCALCQAAFEVGDKVVVCPEDRVRHHVACWEANDNHCVALGCSGHGRLSLLTRPDDGAIEQEELIIEAADPLLDPANIPNRPIPRQSGWKGMSKLFKGCALAGGLVGLTLCVTLVLLIYMLIGTMQ